MYWCLLSIASVAVLGLLLRSVTRKLTANIRIIVCVDEFIGSLGSSVVIMELGVIAGYHGGYSVPHMVSRYIYLILQAAYFKMTGGLATPLSFIASYYKNGKKICFSLFFIASIIITQFVALYAGQHFAWSIWTLEDRIHVEALHAVCNSPMSPYYPWYLLALCEAVGVVILMCLDAVTPPLLKVVSGATAYMTLYFFLSHISGCYFSPVIATVYSFRCSGHTSDWEHFAVYWIAPVVGMVISCELLEGKNKLMMKKDAKKIQ